MKVSLNWLSDYVAHGLTADALAEAITMAGLEVEEVEPLGPALDGVVVGHVLDTRKHPGADRLTLCDVDLGPTLTPDGPVQIVCGAPNVVAGQKVAVAPVGTTLMLPSREDPQQRAPLTLKRAKIRGEESNGMICAEDELGLGDDHSGILVLDDAATVGQPFTTYLAEQGILTGDAVLDVAITPNRPDATSHIGVARDVAALVGQPLRLPEVDVPEVGGEATAQVTVEIEDAEGCPRYVGLLVRNVRVGPSPEWLRERLEAVGVRSINNVVDVTNYVLHEMGQPLHAFDFERIAGAKIVVRRSRAGETITTLDDQERKLPEGTVLICDAEKPIAVAGVMGGANSEVSEATTTVLLESAYFEPRSIRRAAKALGLATDASYRFERGVDPTGQARAAARAAQLLVEVAGAEIVPGLVDANPTPYAPRSVTLRLSRVRRVLGGAVPEDAVVRLLTAIGFEIEEAPDRALDAFAEEAMRSERLTAAVAAAREVGLHCTIPPWRPDVTREVDVIEEVARLWGLARLPHPAAAAVPLVPIVEAPAARLLDDVRGRLVGLGFREVFSNSLLPREVADRFADAALPDAPAEVVETLNPVSREMTTLRPSLLPGLLTALAYNQARGADALRLFETGHVFRRSADPSEVVEGYHEHTEWALALSGPVQHAGPDTPARGADFYDLKGAAEILLAALDVPAIGERPYPEADALFAYRLDLVADGRRLGFLARVADAVADAYDLRAPAFVAAFDGDALLARSRRAEVARYRPVSRFPAVERDLAVVVGEATPVGPLLATLHEAGTPLLQEARVFDVYRGPGVPDGQKSVAFALRFGADKTLTDAEVDGRMRRLVGALERAHGAALRG